MKAKKWKKHHEFLVSGVVVVGLYKHNSLIPKKEEEGFLQENMYKIDGIIESEARLVYKH